MEGREGVVESRIDELYARWQKNPDAAQTVALCEALRTSTRADLVEIVGSHAARQLDVPTLLATARMYSDTGRLDDAQEVLVAAGRLAPRDGDVYRCLGDVLLRRGDAERAEKVLERAVQFGARDGAALLEKARALLPTQRASGTSAVAEAVARDLASAGNIATMIHGSLNAPPSARTNLPAAAPPPKRIVPVTDDEDVETQIRKNNDIKAALEDALAPLSSPRPAAGLPPPVPPPRLPEPDPLPPRGLPEPAMYAPPVGPQTAGIQLPPPSSGAMAAFGTSPLSSPVASAPAPSSPRAPPSLPKPPAAAPPEPEQNPLLAALARPAKVASDGRVPEPRDVLEALQVAGIFEPDGAVKPQVFAWSQPEAGKRRILSTVALVLLAVLLIGGGGGTYYYVRDKRAKEHLIAEQMLTQVDKDIEASDAKLLEPAEKTIAKAFDMESRSPHAALTWLHERVMVGLLKGGADLAFEDSTTRAKTVGIEEKKIAFAHVASFLFQGDTAGAAATIAKWDAVAQEDPWFQLIAGATFERAGDARALERYNAAVKLAPDLFVAQVLLTRAMAVDGDPRQAMELAKEIRAKRPDRPEGAALVALAWARDPMRGEPPPEVKEVTEKEAGLPVGLLAVPHASRAILALEKHALDDAKPALQKGLAVAETPGIATWLGSIALSTGDEQLARKAALAAVSFSAVYPPARVLAARVALLGARLDEAMKATEDLPPSSPDVAIVAAAVAYEKLDVSKAFESIPDDTKKLPFVVPLVRGQALLGGTPGPLSGDKLVDTADDDAPWADLVAMDTALDTGDLETADKIAAQWKGGERALRAIRLARLARWQGKLEDADRFSKYALEAGTVTMRALSERVFTLVAMKKDAEALALFKSYPNVGGPLAKWLRAYVVASHGKHDEAKAIVGQEDPPSAAAPMPARMIAASAYGALKDTRHGNEYVKSIAAAGFVNPDVVAAGEKVGAKLARKAR